MHTHCLYTCIGLFRAHFYDVRKPEWAIAYVRNATAVVGCIDTYLQRKS